MELLYHSLTGIFLAIHRIARLNKMKISIQLKYFSFVIVSIMLFSPTATNLCALEFKTSGGTLSGGFDTTISTGAAWRVEERDEDLVGSYNGGKAPHVNGDDGNLNYDRGIV